MNFNGFYFDELWDIIVVGAGPAGLTAGFFGARGGHSTLVIGSLYDSHLARARTVNNFPGIDEFVGIDFLFKLKDQVEQWNGQLLDGEVVSIETKNGRFIVQIKTQGVISTCQASTVVLSMGTLQTRLMVPGEREFLGRGVYYCALCEGYLIRDKTVVVYGEGVALSSTTLWLADLAKSVLCLALTEELDGDKNLLSRLKSIENVEVRTNVKLQKILGENKVQGIQFMDRKTRAIETLDTEFVFIESRTVPAIQFAKTLNLALSSEDYILVDRSQHTSLAGVFAAGDITGGFKQVIKSSAEGAVAVLSASDFLKRRGTSARQLISERTPDNFGLPDLASVPEQSESIFTYLYNNLHFAAKYRKAQLDPEPLILLHAFHDINAVLVTGKYCPECYNYLPLVAKLSLNLPTWAFSVVSVEEEGVIEQFNIKHIPTLILSDSRGIEIGRKILSLIPKSSSLEREIYLMISKAQREHKIV